MCSFLCLTGEVWHTCCCLSYTGRCRGGTSPICELGTEKVGVPSFVREQHVVAVPATSVVYSVSFMYCCGSANSKCQVQDMLKGRQLT